MLQLYKIEQEYLELINRIEEAGGELTPEAEEALKVNEDRLEQTVYAYKTIMDTLEDNVERADKEIKRVQAFKKVKQNTLDRFKGALLEALLLFGQEDKKGIKRLEFENLRLSTRRSTFVDIISEGNVPDKYLKIDVSKLTSEQYKALLDISPEIKDNAETSISKRDIKEDIQNGIEVDGAELSQRYSLSIR